MEFKLDLTGFNIWYRNYIIRRYFLSYIYRLIDILLFVFVRFVPRKIYEIETPIFIIGCSRSGTTIFDRSIAMHPEICTWSEAAQILDLNFYDKDLDHFKSEMDLKKNDLYRISFLFGIKAKIFGAKTFVNKHPENSLRIRWLKTIFPKAKFIHFRRNGMAVTESNFSRSNLDRNRRNWPFGLFPKPINWVEYTNLPLEEQFAHQWSDITNHIRKEAKSFLNDKEYLEISYEDFCEQPEVIMRRVDEFCNVNPLNRKALYSSPLISRNSKWSQTLNHDQIARIDNIVKATNKKLGYNTAK